MAKRKLTLSINENLLEQARKNRINISSFLEVRLQEYLALINGAGIVRKDGSGLVEIRTQDLLRVRETS